MAEHLAVVSPRTLKKLFRGRVLTWTRRRKEAPVGRVHRGDAVFFKRPGGPVVAAGRVSWAREDRRGHRYLLTARFRRVQKLPVPFPVIKHDRRSWVVCAPPPDTQQQRLLAAPAPTVKDLLRSVHAGRQRLPSRRAIVKLLAQAARQRRPEGSLLLWLALLAAMAEGDHAVDTISDYAKKPARRVVPFAVFS